MKKLYLIIVCSVILMQGNAQTEGLLMKIHRKDKNISTVNISEVDSITFTECEGYIPSVPGSIAGSSKLCRNSTGNVYSISPVEGATTYTWTVPAGATITGGQGTTEVSVNFGTLDGSVCVTADNIYGTSPASCFAITLSEAVSATAAGINATDVKKITWNWSKVTGAFGYKWNTTNDYNTATDNGTSTTYTQTGLTCNTAYTLYIWAYNPCGNSAATVLLQSTSACPYVCGQDGTFIDARDGQIYGYVDIGTQRWMCQNLNIGTYVSSNTTGSEHSDVANNGIIEKYCNNNDVNNCAIYGGLYDWNEMMGYVKTEGARGICPEGWHLPSDDEWKQLEMYLGMSQWDVNLGDGWRSTTGEGGKLKETGIEHWRSPNTGASNSSHFTALPGGCRDKYGSFCPIGNDAYFWTSTSSAWNPNGYNVAYFRNLSCNSMQIFRAHCGPGIAGNSVRCVKD